MTPPSQIRQDIEALCDKHCYGQFNSDGFTKLEALIERECQKREREAVEEFKRSQLGSDA